MSYASNENSSYIDTTRLLLSDCSLSFGQCLINNHYGLVQAAKTQDGNNKCYIINNKYCLLVISLSYTYNTNDIRRLRKATVQR